MKRIAIYIILGILLLAIIGTVVYYENATQSILSQSKVNIDSGKVYWTLTGSANSNTPEIYTFTPTKQTLQDGSGTTIIPKKSLTLAISKIDNKCVYKTNLITKSYNLGLSKFYYYTLTNPEKIANVNFTDGNGVTKTLDGALVQEISIKDSDGSGEIRIQTQGLLTGKFNCPNYDNTALYVAKDGSYGFFYRDDIDSLVNGWWTLGYPKDTTIDKFKDSNYLIYNTGFTNTLKPYIYNRQVGEVIGNINFGNVVFTITADQDYFNSVIYTPPTIADPEIVLIDIPSEIRQDTLSSMTIKIKNKVSNSGNLIITPTSDITTFTPSQTIENIIGNGNIEISFLVRAKDIVQSGKVSVKVCGSSQFSNDIKCDEKSKSFSIVSSNDNVKIECGDNICQSSETKETCPNDCKSSSNNKYYCKWYQEEKGTSKGSLWGLLPGKQAGCYTSGWVYLAIVLIALIILMIIFWGLLLVMNKLR